MTLDIGDGMIPLPLTPKTQFSVEVPISLISNDIVRVFCSVAFDASKCCQLITTLEYF